MEIKILFVDDDPIQRETIPLFFEDTNYTLHICDNVASAKQKIAAESYHIIITDKNMIDEDNANLEGGLEVLRYAKEVQPRAQVIMITGYATLDTALNALRLGAFDYLKKPVKFDDIMAIVDRIVLYQSFLNSENAIGQYKNLHNIIVKLFELSEKYKDTELEKMLRGIDYSIDALFDSLKIHEKAILSQRDSLSKVSGLAEIALEHVSESEPIYRYLQEIVDITDLRL